MAVKVISAKVTPNPSWHTRRDDTKILATRECILKLVMEKNGKRMKVEVIFFEGFHCDGLSVPWGLRWFIPKWDDKNQLTNMAGAGHDWLYATGGNYGMFNRSECDDIFRGILREAGYNRFHASTADLMIGLFAGGKNHWEKDEYGASVFAKLVIVG